MLTTSRHHWLGIVALTLLLVTNAHADSLDAVSIMALSPVEGRAVVKLTDGKMHVLKVGDAVPGTQAVLQQVLPDKMVVEETIERSGDSVERQTVWIYKPTKPGAPSRVQRLARDTEKPGTVKPQTIIIQDGDERKVAPKANDR